MPALMPAYVRAVAFVSRALGIAAAGLIAVSVAVVCDSIVERSFVGVPTVWQTEFVTFAILAATFLGAPYVLLLRGHVGVDVLPHYLGRRARLWLALAAAALAVAFCAVILATSFAWWWDLWRSGETKPSLWAPQLWLPAASIPVGFAALLAQYAADIWCLATGRAMPFGMARGDAQDGP
jgi:TRAP-type C4-dicarboxylate transport system permease small subunit